MRWRNALLLLGCFVWATSCWAVEPRLKRYPELFGWSGSTAPDLTSAGTITGTTVATTDMPNCDVVASDSAGNFYCSTTAGSGDITAVTAGSGLTGGGTTGAVTLDVGEGLAIDAAADSVAFDPTELLGSRTFGDASTDTIVWTWDRNSGTDPTLTFGSGTVTGQVVGASTALQVGGDYITDITGSGLSIVGSTLTSSGGSGDSITVNSSAATDPDFADGDIDWTLTGGNSITATVGCTNCVTLTTETAGTLDVEEGGTEATSFTANGVLYGNTAGALQVTSQGGTNTVLTANAGAPVFSATPTITSLTATNTVTGTIAMDTVTIANSTSTGNGVLNVADSLVSTGTVTGVTVVASNRLEVDLPTFVVDGVNNVVGIGTLTPATTCEWCGGITVVSNVGLNAVEVVGAADSAESPGAFIATQSRGTVASPTAGVSGDKLLELGAIGYHGTNYDDAASIKMLLDAEPGTAGDTTDMPGRIDFYTTPDGSGEPTLRLRLDSAGNMDFGNGAGVRFAQDGDGALEITGQSTGNDECLATNYDDTANTIVYSNCASSTGVTGVNFSSLTVTGQTVEWDSTFNVSVNASRATSNYTLSWPVDDGTSGQSLTTDGNGILSWAAGGADTNADKEFVWPMSALLPLEAAADSIPPLAKDAGTNSDALPVDFDQTTDECRTFTFLVPPDITSGGTVTFTITWYSTITSNNVVWDIRHNSGVAEGTSWDGSLTTVAAAADAVQGTTKQITTTTWTETQTNLAWAASDFVTGNVCRDADNGSDNMAGDARGLVFAIRIPRS